MPYIHPPCRPNGENREMRKVGCHASCLPYQLYSEAVALRRKRNLDKAMLNGYTAAAAAKVRKRAESSMPKARLQAAIKREEKRRYRYYAASKANEKSG